MSDEPEVANVNVIVIDILTDFLQLKDKQKAFEYLKYEKKRLKNEILYAKLKKRLKKLEEPQNIHDLNNTGANDDTD